MYKLDLKQGNALRLFTVIIYTILIEVAPQHTVKHKLMWRWNVPMLAAYQLNKKNNKLCNYKNKHLGKNQNK